MWSYMSSLVNKWEWYFLSEWHRHTHCLCHSLKKYHSQMNNFTFVFSSCTLLVCFWLILVTRGKTHHHNATWRGLLLTLLMSIPVKASTDFGKLATISRISAVILLAPISHLPFDTITIFLHWASGAATSAAIYTW